MLAIYKLYLILRYFGHEAEAKTWSGKQRGEDNGAVADHRHDNYVKSRNNSRIVVEGT